MADFTVANPITTLNNLASKLGLDRWQLQEGNYHNWTFHTVQGITDTILSNFSPVNVGAGVSAVKGLLGQTGSAILGKSDGIPFGTNSQLISNTNISKKKYVINQLPNGKDNVQYLGYEGDTFNFDVLVWGISYDNMIRQIQTVYNGDINYKDKASFRVLTHPIYGKVYDCHFLEYQVTYYCERWRCAIVNLHFHSEQPIGSFINTISPLSTLANISVIIQSILALINVLYNGWLESNLFLSSATGGAVGGNNINSGSVSNKVFGNVSDTTALVNTQSAVQNSIGNSILTTQVLVGSLLPNYTNNQLNAQQSTTKDASSFNYYINHYSPNDVNNLLNLLSTSITGTISSIQNLSGSQYYSSIVQFNSILSNINQLALNLLNSYYGTITSYETPSDMSVFEICVANSLDFESSLPKIIQLNKGSLYWMTKVNKGLVISLPKLLVGV